ncbi:RuBisCO large subunit C-terminal-like domain-containing protein, partial [Streptomyces sp. NPDC006356]
GDVAFEEHALAGQNVTTPAPTYAAVGSTDPLMLAGGGVAGHPDGPAAGVRSLRAAWAAAVGGTPLERAAHEAADAGDTALQRLCPLSSTRSGPKAVS